MRSSSRRSYVNVIRSHFSAIFLSLLIIGISSFYPVFKPDNTNAALIPWHTNASGTADGFTWQGGGSDKGLFDNPILIDGHILRFYFNDNFIAQSLNGKTGTKYDRLQVDISAQDDFLIEGIKISESGLFGIDTLGKVSSTGAVFLTNLTQYETRNTSFLMNPVMPISSPAIDPNWKGRAEIEQLDWSHLRIVLNNNLIATSLQGSNSFINKKSFDIDIIVPEPTTVAVLTLGCFALRFMTGRRIKIRESGEKIMKTVKSNRNFIFFIIFLQTLLFCHDAQAFFGNADDFDWSNGQCLNGHFSDPVLTDDHKTLVFEPLNFRADNLEFTAMSDQVEFELTAHTDLYFESISISEFGDFSFPVGSGYVNVSGLLTITNMDNTSQFIIHPLAINPVMPVYGSDYSQAVDWASNSSINIDHWTHIKINLINSLEAQSDGWAYIQKKGLANTITIKTVPEPATICLLVLGSLVFVGRKK